MARYRQLGHGLATRIEQAEQRVHVHESSQERQSRELLTRWLAKSDKGAELWLEVTELREDLGGNGMLDSAEGGAAIEAVVANLYRAA